MELEKESPDFSRRAGLGSRAGLVGIGCNLLLCLLKLIPGLMLGSLSLIADGVNNLSDGASSVITAVGFRLARKPADEDHPFGHARYEYLSGLWVSLLIVLAGGELAKSAIHKILNPAMMVFSPGIAGILFFSIAVKGCLWRYFHNLGKLLSSNVLAATAADCRNDCITTFVILLCMGAEHLCHVPLDGWAGLAVSVFILISGIRMSLGTVSPLLGARPGQALYENLQDLLRSDDRVLGVHELLIHDYGPGRLYASAHAELSAELSSVEAHDVVDALEKKSKAQYGIELVIHCDPVQ